MITTHSAEFSDGQSDPPVVCCRERLPDIRAQIKAANDFGHVLDDDVIAKAQEIDRQFNAISSTVGNTLKSAIVSVVDSMVDFLESLRAVDKRRSSTIQGNINDVMRQKQEVAKAIADIDSADSRLNDRQRAKAKGTHEIRMRQLDEQENVLIRELENRPEVMNFVPKSSGGWTPPAYKAPPETPAKKSRSASVTQAERERKAVQELIAELEEELRIVGLSDAAKRASTASRQAGAAATDEERAKVIALNEAIYQGTEARRKADEQTLYYRDLTKAGLDDLFGAIESGKSFWEAMGDVAVNSLKRIADTLLDDVLDALFKVNGAAGGSGGGLLSSLFGGLFGGGTGGFASLPKAGPMPAVRPFAKGGAFTNSVVSSPTMFSHGGGLGVMGEKNPEAVMPLSRDSNGRLGVSVNGSSNSSQSLPGGTSEVMVSLSPELIGQILQQAQSQSIKLVQKNNAQKNELYMNGSPR